MALALQREGHEVVLYSDRTPESLLKDTPATGTANTYDEALAVERRFGMDTYQDKTPPLEGFHALILATQGFELMEIAAEMPAPGRGVDTRLISVDRIEAFVKDGGQLLVEAVTPESLDDIAAGQDLVLVSTGKGGLSGLFPRDDARSLYSDRQRYLLMVTVRGLPLDGTAFDHRQAAHGQAGSYFAPLTVIADTGETIWSPYYHKDAGQCWSTLCFARPGGRWEEKLSSVDSASSALEIVKELHREDIPWDADVIASAEVIAEDKLSWLKGAVVPTVRAAAGLTPGGRPVMSLGDTSIAYDPIGAQGAQSGIKQVAHYVDAIAARGEDFDADWMSATFDAFYSASAEPACYFTKLFLEGAAASEVHQLIFTVVNGSQAVCDGLFALTERPQSGMPFRSTQDVLEWAGRLSGEDPEEVVARGTARLQEAEAAKERGQSYFASTNPDLGSAAASETPA
jgi:Styrene monooxygenase A putative substrate binding domain